MTDLPRPRRKVTRQIAISPSPSSSGTTSSPAGTARVRAKVDVSSLPPPSGAGPIAGLGTGAGARPSLRSKSSTTSLRSATSTASSRARSPVPPLPSPPVAHRTNSTPVSRPAFRPSVSQGSTPTQAATTRRPPTSGRSSPVKYDGQQTTPIARIRSSAVTQNAFGSGAGGASPRPSNEHSPVTKMPPPPLRAKVTATAAPTTPGRFPPLLSPNPSSSISAHEYPQTQPASPAMSPQPTLQSPSFAQHAIMAQYQPHPISSAPGSPLHPSTPLELQRSASIKAKHRKPLPYNPAVHPPSLPPTPLSPEVRTVDLPLMTPTRTRSREDDSRRPSLGGISSRQDFPAEALLEFDRVERDRLSGSTVVDDVGESKLGKIVTEAADLQDSTGDDDVPLETEEDVKEARINRKIADLEITNASLLAINRSLEATKSKQRSEIMKLRRMLRESLSGARPGAGPPPTIPSYLGLLGQDENGANDDQDEEDEDMKNPELDARWDRVADMVDRMKLKATTAVEKGKEEIKVGPGRVLDWTELEGLNSSFASMGGTPEPERTPEHGPD